MSNSGNESDKSGAIPFLLSRGDDSQSSGCDSMYSDEVIRRLEGGDTFMESLQPLVDRLPRDDMSLGSSGKEFRTFAICISLPSDNLSPFVCVQLKVPRETSQKLPLPWCLEEIILTLLPRSQIQYPGHCLVAKLQSLRLDLRWLI